MYYSPTYLSILILSSFTHFRNSTDTIWAVTRFHFIRLNVLLIVRNKLRIVRRYQPFGTTRDYPIGMYCQNTFLYLEIFGCRRRQHTWRDTICSLLFYPQEFLSRFRSLDPRRPIVHRVRFQNSIVLFLATRFGNLIPVGPSTWTPRKTRFYLTEFNLDEIDHAFYYT